MGKKSREKGKVGERLLANELREALPDIAHLIKRGLQSRDGGEVSDVEGVAGWWFEHKFGKSYRSKMLDAAVGQAAAACHPYDVPLVVLRARGGKKATPYAVLRWPDMLKLIAELRDLRAMRDRVIEEDDSAPGSDVLSAGALATMRGGR